MTTWDSVTGITHYTRVVVVGCRVQCLVLRAGGLLRPFLASKPHRGTLARNGGVGARPATVHAHEDFDGFGFDHCTPDKLE